MAEGLGGESAAVAAAATAVAAAASDAVLVPSQAVSSSNRNRHTNSNDNRSRRRNRRNPRKKSSDGNGTRSGAADENNGGVGVHANSNANSHDNANANGVGGEGDDAKKRKNNRRRNRNRDRTKKKSDHDHENDHENDVATTDVTGTSTSTGTEANANRDGVGGTGSHTTRTAPNDNVNVKANTKKRRDKRQKRTRTRTRTKNKKNNEKKYPWRKHIPHGTVDPISLEPLDALPYPPFALMIDGSTPIPIWPIPDNDNDGNGNGDHNDDDDGDEKREENGKVKVNNVDREEQLLSEQWGDSLHILKKKDVTGPGPNPGPSSGTLEESAKTNLEEEIEGQPDGSKPKSSQPQSNSKLKPQHFHLFDGKVLAFYLVSELQFIDPLNRRDLTREEVANLDAYLKRHRLKKMAVLDAYDEKGVSVSTAGAVGQTREGRLRIRQEQARQLLNSLFNAGGAGGDAANSILNGNDADADADARRNRRGGRRRNGRNIDNDIDNQQNHPSDNLGAMSSAQYPHPHPQQQAQTYGAVDWMQEEGIYGHDDGGMIIIDDDLNPGLRGRGLDQQQQRRQQRGGGAGGGGRGSVDMNWASGTLATRYGYNSRNRVDAFPALPTASAAEAGQDANTSTGTAAENAANTTKPVKPTKPVATSKSLSKIGNLVKKTNPKELEKQRKAREAALRQAEIANMPFEEVMRRMQLGDGDAINNEPNGLIPVPPMSQTTIVTEGQLERNRKIASALGVAPATARVRAKQLNSGWARPTTIPSEMDEFGNELNTTQYPDDLIIEAREQMTELMRLEKKWITFLKDDKAASCPLKPMARPVRKFVHAYSDFWNLHTQSFDPEPRRYIHCVKLLETRAPRPLLSQAVRSWRGPAPPTASIPMSEKTLSVPSEQTAGEDTASSGRQLPLEEERSPLNLAPRTVIATAVGVAAPPGAMFDMALAEPLSSASTNNNHIKGPASASQEAAPRFAPMLAERERPRLNLDPRTKPLELPKFERPPSARAEELAQNRIIRRNAVAERKKAEEEKKQSILAAAFASDDEENDNDSESEWEVEEAVYSGSDSEDE